MFRHVRAVCILFASVAPVVTAVEAQAANYVSFNGSMCSASNASERSSFANYYTGTYNTSSATAKLQCPINRNNGQATTGATIAISVYKSSTATALNCWAYAVDLYSNLIVVTPVSMAAGVSGTQRLTFNHLPSQAWSTYEVYCNLNPGDAVVSLGESE